ALPNVPIDQRANRFLDRVAKSCRTQRVQLPAAGTVLLLKPCVARIALLRLDRERQPGTEPLALFFGQRNAPEVDDAAVALNPLRDVAFAHAHPTRVPVANVQNDDL